MSSLLMALAVNAIQKGNVKSTRTMLLGTIFFGCIFLGGQVFEFAHFVQDKKMTLSNSIFGSTFYTLTGTHGTHVAIGVLLLGMMYVRTFKPTHGGSLGRNFLHLLAFAVAAGVAFLFFVPGLLEVIEGASLRAMLSHDAKPLILGALACAALVWFARTSDPAVEFGEKNAIDVEAIGLYWHFVDIVWIIIFTAVYLLEYL
jgi:cytochrome o ubiquinol oxidase subunit 3